MKNLSKCLVFAVVLMAAASQASAYKVTATLQSVSAQSSINLTVSSLGLTYDGSSTMFNWQRSSPVSAPGGNNDWPYAPPPGGKFDAFCIQLTQDVNLGPHTFEVEDLSLAPLGGGDSPMGSLKAKLIKGLWYAHRKDTVLTTNGGNATPFTQAANVNAFQMAIWEIVYENLKLNTLDVTGGNITFTNGQMALATTYLNDAKTAAALNLGSDLFALTASDIQDQVFLTDAPSQGLPLPATAWSGLALLSAVAVGKLLRSRH